jgi:hypothetical protein
MEQGVQTIRLGNVFDRLNERKYAAGRYQSTCASSVLFEGNSIFDIILIYDLYRICGLKLLADMSRDDGFCLQWSRGTECVGVRSGNWLILLFLK